MPKLSRSHRTTAPAMATEPCEDQENNQGRSEPLADLSIVTTNQCKLGGVFSISAGLFVNDASSDLERVARRLLSPQFVGNGGQQAVVGDHRLGAEEE